VIFGYAGKYEGKVKELMQAGYSNAKISREFKLALNTVKKYFNDFC